MLQKESSSCTFKAMGLASAARFTIRTIFISAASCLLALEWTLLLGFFFTEHPKVPETAVYDPTVRHENINGVKIHLELFGNPNAPLVIVLQNGPGQDFNPWLPLKALSNDYQVLFYDPAGSGLSERVGRLRVSFDRSREELNTLIDRYSPGKPVRMIADDWGAMMASWYLVKYPEKVQKLVMVEPTALIRPASVNYQLHLKAYPKKWSIKGRYFASKVLLRSLHIQGHEPDLTPDYIYTQFSSLDSPYRSPDPFYCHETLKNIQETGKLENKSKRLGVLAIPGYLDSDEFDSGLLNIDLTPDRKKFTSPVLFLSGACNTLTGEAFQRQFHLPLFANAKMVTIPEAGHSVLIEKTDQSLLVIRAFFNELP